MKAPDAGSAAVPAALVTAASAVRMVGTELSGLPGGFAAVLSAGQCSGQVPAALSGLVRAGTGALDRLGDQVQDLGTSVEAAAEDFLRADGG